MKDYDLLIVTDDDIYILDDYIDKYVEVINKYDLKLAKPARNRHGCRPQGKTYGTNLKLMCEYLSNVED